MRMFIMHSFAPMAEDRRPYLTESVWSSSAERVDTTRERGVHTCGERSYEDGPIHVTSSEGESVELPTFRIALDTWRRIDPVGVCTTVDTLIDRGRGEERVRVPSSFREKRTQSQCHSHSTNHSHSQSHSPNYNSSQRQRREKYGVTQVTERAGTWRGVWPDIAMPTIDAKSVARMTGEGSKEKWCQSSVQPQREEHEEVRRMISRGRLLPPAPLGAVAEQRGEGEEGEARGRGEEKERRCVYVSARRRVRQLKRSGVVVVSSFALRHLVRVRAGEEAPRLDVYASLGNQSVMAKTVRGEITAEVTEKRKEEYCVQYVTTFRDVAVFERCAGGDVRRDMHWYVAHTLTPTARQKDRGVSVYVVDAVMVSGVMIDVKGVDVIDE